MYTRRDQEEELRKLFKRPEIIAVVGPRQCGKTTLIKTLLEEERQKGKKISELTLDSPRVRVLYEKDPDGFVKQYVEGYDYVFIDEIQYTKKGGQVLKYLYDTIKTKFIVSGSSAPELSIRSLRYLVGRVIMFTLLPFSLREYVRSRYPKLEYALDERPSDAIRKQLNGVLEEYIAYGGYPAVVLAENEGERRRVLENLFTTFILRDVRETFGILKDEQMVRLIRTLAAQTGNIVNYQELSSHTGIEVRELKRLLTLLEKTYVIQLVLPFSTNKRKELSRSPKVYFMDTGFRNAALEQFITDGQDRGALLENFSFSEIRRRTSDIRYWRTKSKAEMDFIINRSVPLEIKATPKTTRSMHAYITQYQPKNVYIASLDDGTLNKPFVVIPITHLAQPNILPLP
jgi:hypothetical protein